MSVISIDRDSGISVNIVRMHVSDSLSAVGVSGYILAQQANITAANYGTFQWNATDEVLVTASDGNAFFTISSDFNSLISAGTEQVLATVVTAAQLNGMYAAPVLAVPAPVAGTVNVVNKVYLVQNYGTAQFAAGGAIQLQYGSTVHGAGEAASASLAAATLNGATASTIYELGGVASILVSGAAGDAIYLSNATAAFTTGDSVFTMYVYYRNIVG